MMRPRPLDRNRLRALGAALFATLALAGCDAGGTGAGPAGNGAPWFEERARAAGLDFVHDSGHRGPHYMPEAISGGAALFDMDGDGDLDAYLVQGGPLLEPGSRPPNRLFAGDGRGGFAEVPASVARDAADTGYGMGAACGDYDGDGDVDLYVTNYGRDTLLRNDGGGSFTDVTREAGIAGELWSASAAFFDMDGDADLDLFVTHYVNWRPESDTFTCENKLGGEDYCGPQTYGAPTRDTLYRNDGGRFVDVSEEAGLGRAFGNGLGVLAADFDGDGRLDVFVANDMNLDQLWMNRGNGTFEDEALVAGCAVDLEGGRPKAGMGVTAADVDGDGDPDLMVCNLVESSDSVFRNDGGFFTDVTGAWGLGTVSRGFTRFGMGFADFDNDGDVDLYQANGRILRSMPAHAEDLFAEPNLVFRREADGRFAEVLPRGGTVPTLFGASRGAAFGDVDGDGGVDVLVVNRDGPAHLLMNRVPGRGAWIGLRVRERSGAPAEGARVTLVTSRGERVADVRSAYSYLSCNDAGVHFGLGDDPPAVEDVRVRWTDGTETAFGPLAPGAWHALRRPAGSPAPGREKTAGPPAP